MNPSYTEVIPFILEHWNVVMTVARVAPKIQSMINNEPIATTETIID